MTTLAIWPGSRLTPKSTARLGFRVLVLALEKANEAWYVHTRDHDASSSSPKEYVKRSRILFDAFLEAERVIVAFIANLPGKPQGVTFDGRFYLVARPDRDFRRTRLVVTERFGSIRDL